MYLPRKTRMAISVLLALSGLLPSVIQAQQVPDALSCRTCAISVQEVARFGSAAEPAPHTPRDVLYHAGHYWILTDEQVLVFDARGARLAPLDGAARVRVSSGTLYSCCRLRGTAWP
jgi:hypothetical protein